MLEQKSLNCRHSSLALTREALPKGSSINEKNLFLVISGLHIFLAVRNILPLLPQVAERH